MDNSRIWKWIPPSQPFDFLTVPAKPATNEEIARGNVHPTFHQHEFGVYGVRHSHINALEYHEHTAADLISDCTAGTATVHILNREENYG